MKFFNLLFANPQTPDGQGAGGGMMQSLLFFGLIIVVFYFFMIRPQMRKNKKIQTYREALKKGDNIVTIGGLHGKIVDIKETAFIIEVEDGSRLKIEKAAVALDGTQIAEQQK
jgi:preprotein translocase subunit YajC